ncbi:MAG: TolC family protein [Acidobacteria bacterium]|nr:TolC family protein [Acidobacteriota bacterium]
MYCTRFTASWLLAALLAAPAWAGAQPAASRLTLADAIARARAVAPEAAAGRARAEAARTGVADAARLPNPIFEFRSENWFSGVSRRELPLDTFAEVTQLIEVGGKRGARRAVAEARAGVEAATAALVERNLVRDVAQVFLEAVRARHRQQALTTQAADLTEMVRVLDRRVAVGTTAEADLLKLRVEQARTALDLVRSETAAAQALAELSARLDVDATLDTLDAPAPPPVDAADVDAVLARRPDVILAVRAVDEARESLRLEQARGVPDPSVNAGYKRTVGYDTALVTVSVPLPVFGRNNLARVIAAGELRAAEFERAAAERRARGELLAAREAATRLTAQARDARTTLVDPARAARDAARAAFQTGALDVLRLVDAERVHADAVLIAIDLEIDAVAAAIAARLAAGEEPLP